jgi:hypothetical protein
MHSTTQEGGWTMPDTPPEVQDPNADLRSFEPLRVMLALGALVLGLIAGIH